MDWGGFIGLNTLHSTPSQLDQESRICPNVDCTHSLNKNASTITILLGRLVHQFLYLSFTCGWFVPLICNNSVSNRPTIIRTIVSMYGQHSVFQQALPNMRVISSQHGRSIVAHQTPQNPSIFTCWHVALHDVTINQRFFYHSTSCMSFITGTSSFGCRVENQVKFQLKVVGFPAFRT